MSATFFRNPNQIFYMVGLAILILSFSSCKEEVTESASAKTETKITSSPKRLISPQPYYNLLNEIEFNKTILLQHHVKSYTATYYPLDSSEKKFKECFIQLSPLPNRLQFYIVIFNKGKADTLVKEFTKSANNTQINFDRKVKTPDGKNNLFAIQDIVNEYHELIQRTRINTQTKRQDKEILTYENGQLKIKELQGLGKETFSYHPNGLLKSYVLTNAKQDTIRMAFGVPNQETHEVKFVKGGNETYWYRYQGNQLKQIKWLENDRIRVLFDFDYNQKGLLQTRTIHSYIQAFPNSRTSYTYN